MIKTILIIGLIVNLFASNSLLKNEGIIDIGRFSTSTEIEVPKEKILRDPSVAITANQTVYEQRINSQLIDCKGDFLGTEACSVEQNVCPSNEEYTDSTSIVNFVSKSYVKLCPVSTIMVGNRCYKDTNRDGIKDEVIETITDNNVWANIKLSGSNCKSSTVLESVPANTSFYVRHHSWSACDDDSNAVAVYKNGVSAISESCDDSKDTGFRLIVDNSSSTVRQSVSMDYQDCHSGRGWDHSTMARQYRSYSDDFPIGWEIDDTNKPRFTFYKESVCPNGTIEQTDGSCLMEYNWYTYSCPSDANIYDNPWQVVDAGSDCGNVSCANSAIPPANNCVRANYTCPLDENIKCAKIATIEDACESGYVWKDNTCERIEKFCGDSIYNSTLDICQNVYSSVKDCTNPNDIYNASLNKCESSNKACPNGVFSEELNTCVGDTLFTCVSDGYEYEPINGKCFDKDRPLCSNEMYTYDSLNNTCVYAVTACKDGMQYNENTNKCEEVVCNILDTHRNGVRCETNSLCVGILTVDGRCVPTQRPVQ